MDITLTNLGIISRLEQDIDDYLSPFGFCLRRVDGDTDGESCAVLTIPTLPCNQHCYTSTINPPHDGVSELLGTLHLHIHNEAHLATVGPLLRTYLRLSHESIHPRRLRGVVDCCFVIGDEGREQKRKGGVKADDGQVEVDVQRGEKQEDGANDDQRARGLAWKRKQQQKQQQQQQQQDQQQTCSQQTPEEVAAKRMIHHIHMLVRNSMGSALCLDLVVVLPWYRSRQSLDSTKEDAGNVNETKPITVYSVQAAMENNRDASYPSVHLVQRAAPYGHKDNYTSEREPGEYQKTLHLNVNSRMCTVRHQPKLFRWVSTLSSCTNTSIPGPTSQSILGNQVAHYRETLRTTPLVVACIEKVANLHRIIMLCNDYDNCTTRSNDESTSLLSSVIVVMPSGNDKLMREYEGAIDNFHKVILGSRRGDGHRPVLVYEDEAPDLILSSIATQQHNGNQNYDNSPSIIGIDLHPKALTLNGDYQTQKTTTAMQKLQTANAIVFGYEGSGIPYQISQDLLNGWLQVPSRSSINVVAAMSIVLDVLLGVLE